MVGLSAPVQVDVRLRVLLVAWVKTLSRFCAGIGDGGS
jgi:hypothetical protein